MKVTYTIGDGRLAIEAEGDTQKAVFTELARLQEVFDNVTCGKCKGTDIRFTVRTVDDNDFFEIHCTNPKCRARFALGQHKKGDSLFPQRKGKDGEWLPDNGWMRYNPQTKQEE